MLPYVGLFGVLKMISEDSGGGAAEVGAHFGICS